MTEYLLVEVKLIRNPVVSTVLRSVGYDAQTHTLEIEFDSGHVYQYTDVPPNVHWELMHAESHGKYFDANIRDEYTYQLVS